ncbi:MULTISPECIES: nickel permease [Thermus]|jgi:high-affinity nickel-transport protein|uniref:Nickel/cobalt efflux system n=1 Tax=Thermus brockianus TaxID=56956 RepID=A0A1J0LYB2_THEBO|nr:nickel permease [Thermus brockianus]APD10587.1 high-affinity nickel permease [Thermus brockianus]
MTGLDLLAVALGMRHGVDPDHLAAVDGLSRVRPSPLNGVYFALGHGGIVTLLAFPAAALLERVDLEALHLPTLLLLLVAGINLYRLLRPEGRAPHRLPLLNPLLLGLLFGLGFETASQLSALALAAELSPLRLGLFFTLGMLMVDGVDGFLASRLQNLARDSERARRASQLLGFTVVGLALFLAAAELWRVDLEALALPLGLGLFGFLVLLRLYALRPA